MIDGVAGSEDASVGSDQVVAAAISCRYCVNDVAGEGEVTEIAMMHRGSEREDVALVREQPVSVPVRCGRQRDHVLFRQQPWAMTEVRNRTPDLDGSISPCQPESTLGPVEIEIDICVMARGRGRRTAEQHRAEH